MAKVVLSEYISLDGVIENPAWTAPYWSDQVAKFKYDELFSSDALLLGRVTYQGFAGVWPSMTDEQGFADRMNSLPKYVATRTLKELEWNARPISGDIAEEITRLKQQSGQDILIYGSADFAQTLLQHNLIDQYHLLVYPVVLGEGKRLFTDERRANLKLVEAKTFDTGVVALIYQPAS